MHLVNAHTLYILQFIVNDGLSCSSPIEATYYMLVNYETQLIVHCVKIIIFVTKIFLIPWEPDSSEHFYFYKISLIYHLYKVIFLIHLSSTLFFSGKTVLFNDICFYCVVLGCNWFDGWYWNNAIKETVCQSSAYLHI